MHEYCKHNQSATWKWNSEYPSFIFSLQLLWLRKQYLLFIINYPWQMVSTSQTVYKYTEVMLSTEQCWETPREEQEEPRYKMKTTICAAVFLIVLFQLSSAVTVTVRTIGTPANRKYSCNRKEFCFAFFVKDTIILNRCSGLHFTSL